MSKGKRKSVSYDDGPVGYKRPPKDGQFKPGQKKPPGSGRRKGGLCLEKLVKKIVMTPFVITKDGKQKKVPYIEAMLKAAQIDSLKGSIHQKIQYLELLKRLAPNLLTPELQPIFFQMIPGDETL